jgi:hypothetical protein
MKSSMFWFILDSGMKDLLGQEGGVLMKSFARSGAWIWFVAALIHFGMSNLIMPLTIALVTPASVTPEGSGLAVTLLVRLTKLLHLPLVTLALYPREWFPGSWVYLPMAANSLIWGIGVKWVAGIYRRYR